MPHVAGWAALYLERHPGAAPAQVKAALVEGATRGALALGAAGGGGGGMPNLLLYAGALGGGGGEPAAAAFGR